MDICVHLEGHVEKILQEAVRRGIASTKADALRLGLLELDDKFRIVRKSTTEIEDEEDLKEAKRISAGIKSGKIKVYPEARLRKLLRE